jgi:hypothetical protein
MIGFNSHFGTFCFQPLLQKGCDFFDLVASRCIYNSAIHSFALQLLHKRFHSRSQGVSTPILALDNNFQIGSIKGLKADERIAKPQTCRNVLLDSWNGCGCQGHDWDGLKARVTAESTTSLTILFTKIMPPFAMDLEISELEIHSSHDK